MFKSPTSVHVEPFHVSAIFVSGGPPPKAIADVCEPAAPICERAVLTSAISDQALPFQDSVALDDP